MRIVLSFCGAPGSGKGTQAEMLVRDYQFHHLVTGDLIRALRATNETNHFAKEVGELYDRGVPQPDHVANKLVFDELDRIPVEKNLILDTYPLSLGQAATLEEFYSLNKGSYRHPVVVYFHITEEEAVKRLMLRQLKEHRTDDKEKVIRFRYREYAKRMAELESFYKPHKRFIQIDGTPSIDEIYQTLQGELSAHHLLS